MCNKSLYLSCCEMSGKTKTLVRQRRYWRVELSGENLLDLRHIHVMHCLCRPLDQLFRRDAWRSAQNGQYIARAEVDDRCTV